MTKQILTTFSVLIAFFVLLFAYTKIAGPIPFSVNSITTTKTDTFQVTGEGDVTVKPDIALATVGIQARGATVEQAQDQINTTINKISQDIKNLGVDAKDIKTSNYNIQPNIDYSNGSQKITGYQANTNLVIKVRDLAKINQVIDTATADGANQVGGVTFDIEDKTKAEDEARQQAITQAKKKAQDAAQIAGFTLGRIINYSENFGGTPQPIPMNARVKSSAGGSTPTSVEPGSSDIKVDVTLSYEIR